MSDILLLVVEKGKAEILEYLLSYDDIIDFNKQYEVINNILSSFKRRYNMSMIEWGNSFTSSCFAEAGRLCESFTCFSKHKSR